jgi:hypothetical protein
MARRPSPIDTCRRAPLVEQLSFDRGIAHSDVYTAILDSFADATCQLKTLSRLRGEVPLTGKFPDNE